ncbi:N-acetylglucosamine-specific PTS transporter subunit IIBC [Halotalea alkalilenta]|uniref:PTS N-acetyl-D-glucosamine transporter n=1 Tax=Halotalea alkalilenta TaxID=376489 RepID=A0A172YGM3_9GAMM|nr:N-acetylglucosamine-specific PTS transporter subunit IIBC [Halotalea alkalilenta]ANF58440.1 PTS N-acetyl-D-glucosamine transporter [Halotalea alkalilenta]
MAVASRFKPMERIQLLGRSLMLPIAVLPIAGILLRIGQPDLLDIAVISAAGGAIFDNLPLVFAIGVAVGIAHDNHGASGLAGVVGYLILQAVLEAIDPEINMGVLGGILIGITAGAWYNRCGDIKLPDYLAFFGGRRFVPIATGVSAVALGYLFGYLWPPVQNGLDALGGGLIASGEVGLFFYGVLNRILIVTGLHHVINNFVWFQFGDYNGVHGDLARFFAGDPTAGGFMAGFFPVMMFGLPAAALAMYHSALPGRRAQVGGLLLSLALTAFLTGVTEPLEFSFMFLSPLLYGIHALLTGVSLALMNWLGVKLGFTFSAGAFDYALSYGLSTRGWLLLPVGAVYFALYYFIFRWAIARFDLKVPGRDDAPAEASTGAARVEGGRGGAFVTALGGAGNIQSVGACTTRLRLVVEDQESVDETGLRGLGARGVLKLRGGNLQVVLGPIADGVADEIRASLAAGGPRAATPIRRPSVAQAPRPQGAVIDSATRDQWLQAFGGAANLLGIEALALTRLRLALVDADALDDAALEQLGVSAVQRLEGGVCHLVFAGPATPFAIAASLGADDRG